MDVLTESLPQQREKAFRQLVAFVNASEGLTIGFIESNFKPDTDAALEALQQDPTCQGIQFEVLNFPNPQLRFVRDLIVQALENLQVKPDKKLVLIVRGLEQSIGMMGDYPPMLQDLNFVRDDFVKSIPHPLLFCLPDYAITRLARYAPDFWAWKSGLFRFQTLPDTHANAFSQTLSSEKIRGSLDLTEKQERIDLLQRLLMEYQPSGHERTQASLRTCLNILNELGVLYRTQGDVVKAEQMFQDALAQITDEPKLLSVKASLTYELGYLYDDLGKPEEALALYQQSLALTERIGNVQGKAAILHQMAIIYANQGEVEKALALYQQSLALTERIGNVQGKAPTLNGMADIYAKQGEQEKAIALYQQSLELTESIGDVQTNAATLHQMAIIYAQQGGADEALALHQQVLKIDERTGDVLGKAATLNGMADIYAKQGEQEKAITLYQQSIDLTERIGNVRGKAATLHQMAGIYADQGEVGKAIKLYEQSLELTERIGNLQGKASTLVMLAQLFAMQEDFNRAIQYTHEALGILTRLKSPNAANVQSILFSILLASPHAAQIQQLLSQGDREGVQTLIQQIVQTDP